MKLKKYGKLTIFSFLLVCFVLSFTFAVGSIDSATADELVTETEISDYYDVNDSFVVPKGTIGGVDAATTVEFPNGKAVKSTEIDLTQAGVYKIHYTAGTKKVVKTFTATNKKYYTSNGAAEPVLTDKTYVYADESTSVGGISVTLSAGDVFYYDKIIDVSKATKDDNLIKFIVNAANPGKCDARLISVKFVDIDNQDNYFEVQYWDPNYTDGRWIYLRAGSNGAINTNNGVYQADTQSYGVDSLGSMKSSNVVNAEGDKAVSRNNTDLCNEYQECSIDYETKIVYGANSPYNDNDGSICDLDNSLYYNKPWEGFTNGKCRVEISASLFQSNSVNLLIMNVWDDDYDDFENARYIDTDEPVLEIDYGDYDETDLPYAVCGKTYDLFDCSAFDYFGAIKKITKKVYFNYGSATESSVTVRNDSFVPNNVGSHTVVYTAEDYFGNKAEKPIVINCVEDTECSIDVGTDANSYLTGEVVHINDYVVNNMSGNISVSVSAVCGDDELRISAEDMSFVPMESGTYTVRYTAVDYIGREATGEYQINVGLNEYPVFLERVVFPKYFIQGYENAVPELSAYDFVNSKEIVAKLYIKEGDSDERAIDGFVFTPSVSNNGKDYDLSVYYKATNADGKTTTYSVYSTTCRNISKYTAGIKDGNRIDKTKLFITDAAGSYKKFGSSQYSSEIVHYSFAKDEQLIYVNPVNTKGFQTEFYVLNDGTNSLNSIDFIFTDYADDRKQLKITLQESEGKIYASVNGGYTKYYVENCSFSSSLTDLVLNDIDGTISVSSASFEYKITEFLNGEAFVPFTDGKAYLQINVHGVSGTAQMAIKSFMGKNFSGYSNVGSPIVSVLGAESSAIDYREEYVLYAASVADAIYPYVKCTVTVIDPDGNYVTTVDGIVLNEADISRDYVIVFEKYGEYIKTYNFGNGSNTKRYIVSDKVSPELNISSEIKTKYQRGDEVTLSATISDNLSSAEDCDVYVSVYKPDGQIETLKINEKYKFEQSGKYKLMFFAYDESGNYVFKYKNITVG